MKKAIIALAAETIILVPACSAVGSKSASAAKTTAPGSPAKTATAAVTAKQSAAASPAASTADPAGMAEVNDSNLLYEGLAATYNGKVYFTGSDIFNEKAGIIVMDPDGKNLKKICDENVQYLNIDNDWIYFLNTEGICKIKTDGSGKAVIFKTDEYYEIKWLKVTGGSAYYVKSGSLIKVSADGGTPETVFTENSSDVNMYSVTLAGNKFYYSNRVQQTDIGNIWCYDLAAKSKTLVKKDIQGLEMSVVRGGYIYYLTKNLTGDGSFQGTNINRMTTAGADSEKVYTTTKIINGINIVGNGLYYCGNNFLGDGKYDLTFVDLANKGAEKTVSLSDTSIMKSGAFTKYTGTDMMPMYINLTEKMLLFLDTRSATGPVMKPI